ncbi:MAG: prepilin-type N-terminal cleavage/methylation domain-containing protein [Phycisphaerales bacterium]|nr:prepilin-type N-terminal cleavage/methylation domain-containing protein [Phycisphaerales bacterium]
MKSDRSNHARRYATKGFTLLEIIIAVTIVALLSLLVVPNVIGQLSKTKQSKAKADVSTLANSVRLYMVNNGMDRVGDDFELEKLSEGDDALINNVNQLNDPWNHQYVLVYPPTYNKDFDVVSYGADGLPGGEGQNKDIINGAP